jgi:hypothetical protein
VSIRATNFVRSLRGLTATEKAVAFTLADHAHVKTGVINPGMGTVAAESGLRSREAASRVVKRLMVKGIFFAKHPPRKNQGGPTLYHVNYEYEVRCVPRKKESAPATPEPSSPTATGLFFGASPAPAEEVQPITKPSEGGLPCLPDYDEYMKQLETGVVAPAPEKPYVADPEAETLKYGRPLTDEERAMPTPRRCPLPHEVRRYRRASTGRWVAEWISDEPLPACFAHVYEVRKPDLIGEMLKASLQ